MAGRDWKSAVKALSYVGAKAFFWPLFRLYFRVRVKGGERVPPRGAFLLAANHFSFADPLILGCFLHRRLWFVMAEDQFEKPVVKTFSRLMDVVPVKAGAAFQLSAVRRILGLLKHGRAVAIFPEGRRSDTGGLLDPQPGLGVFASRAGVPVVPVAIVGTRETYPPGRRYPRPGRVTLLVGEPIAFPGDMLPETISRRSMEAIARLLQAEGRDDYLGVFAVAPASGVAEEGGGGHG
ncbi:MAG: lysophospholipid acyltransferase family protein [Acidobacteriota bacterium]